MPDGLSIAREGAIVTLTLDRPEAGNAFSLALVRALGEATVALQADRAVRAVIVTGAGERVFCAGADLKERARMSPDEARATVALISATITGVARIRVPVIAAVNGHALGGGLELALACDIRVMAPGASVGLTETTLAIIPGGGGTARLARLVGVGRAKEMIFTGRRLSADEAARIGLVEQIGSLDDARALAERIAANGPLAVAAAKQALNAGHDLTLDEAIARESELYASLLDSADRLEGLAAFGEKRPPVYRGE